MAVWGIGAYFPGEKEDKAKQFVEMRRMIIGHSEGVHPKFHQMLRSVQPGDIVFIKARFMLNQPIKIKAIGIATDCRVCLENGMEGREGIIINWIKDMTDQPVDIKKDRKNEGSTTTMYQEGSVEIINQIAELLKS